VHPAVDTAGEVPQRPGVHGAHEEIAGLGALADALDVLQDPGDLGAGEVGGQTQAHAVLVLVRAFVAGQAVADLLGAGILPDDDVVDGLAGVLVPHDGALALVGDAHRGDLVTVDLRLGEYPADDGADVVPDLDGVVLDPAGAREDLLVLLLVDGDDLSVVVEQDGA